MSRPSVTSPSVTSPSVTQPESDGVPVDVAQRHAVLAAELDDHAYRYYVLDSPIVSDSRVRHRDARFLPRSKTRIRNCARPIRRRRKSPAVIRRSSALRSLTCNVCSASTTCSRSTSSKRGPRARRTRCGGAGQLPVRVDTSEMMWDSSRSR